MSRNKYDLRHKEAITLFFKEFFELFFPDIAPRIRFETVQFIDKELSALFSDPENGDRDNRMDALAVARAFLRETDIAELFLIHWEHLGDKQMEFNERMFHYFCGTYYKFRLPIFPIALFTDKEKWRVRIPDTFTLKLFGKPVATYGYNAIKLKDFKSGEFERRIAENPLAAAYLPLTDYPEEQRPAIKAKAVKGIVNVEKGKKQSTLKSLIDVSIALTSEEEKRYRELIEDDPEYKEVKMLESIKEVGIEEGMERGMERGLKQGMEKGMEKGRIIGEILMGERMLKLPATAEESLKEMSIEELREIRLKIEAKMN